MDPFAVSTIALASTSALLNITNTIDSKSDRLRLFFYKSLFKSSISTSVIGHMDDKRCIYRHWLLVIHLLMLHDPDNKPTEDSQKITLPEEVMYLLLYSSEKSTRDHFWKTGTVSNTATNIAEEYYYPKRSYINIPNDPFIVKSNLHNKDNKSSYINIIVEIKTSQSIPMFVRTMSSQWFWGILPYEPTLSEGRKLLHDVMEVSMYFNGLNTLLNDIIYSSPRYADYRQNKCAYELLHEISLNKSQKFDMSSIQNVKILLENFVKNYPNAVI